MTPDQKESMISKIWQTIRKRDAIKGIFLNDLDQFTPAAMAFMQEMARFCYLNKTTTKVSKITGNIDPMASAIAEGRRETLLHIMSLLRFTNERAIKIIDDLNSKQED